MPSSLSCSHIGVTYNSIEVYGVCKYIFSTFLRSLQVNVTFKRPLRVGFIMVSYKLFSEYFVGVMLWILSCNFWEKLVFLIRKCYMSTTIEGYWLHFCPLVNHVQLLLYFCKRVGVPLVLSFNIFFIIGKNEYVY